MATNAAALGVDDAPIVLSDTDRLATLVENLEKTELGQTLVQFGEMAEVQIIFDPDMDSLGYLFQNLFGNLEIYLNSNLPDEVMTLALAHELRHVEQLTVTNFVTGQLSEDEAVRANRIFEADASAYTSGVAHELHQRTGNAGFLDALAEWCEDDIAAAFACAASPDLGWTEDFQPFAAAFDQWFKGDWRTKSYDRESREAHQNFHRSFLSELYKTVAVSLDEKRLQSIGDLAPGVNYLRDTGRSVDRLLSDEYGL